MEPLEPRTFYPSSYPKREADIRRHGLSERPTLFGTAEFIDDNDDVVYSNEVDVNTLVADGERHTSGRCIAHVLICFCAHNLRFLQE